jgi:hypothetical protein
MHRAGAHGWTLASGVTEWSLKIIVLGLNSHWTTLVICCSLLVTVYQAQLCKAPFVLKLLGWKCVTIAPFTYSWHNCCFFPSICIAIFILDLITPLTCMQPQTVFLCRCVLWAGWMVRHIKTMIMGMVLSSETVINLNQLAVWESG